MSSPVIIAVTNQKGGVGKTTTSINVAYCLHKLGKRVLLVDFDPQGNATSGLGIDKHAVTLTSLDIIQLDSSAADAVVPTQYRHIDIIPAVPELANAEVELAKAERRFVRLRQALQHLDSYDVIVIDSPPSLSLLTVNALIASHYVLLPVQAEFYALEGLGQLLETIKLIRKGMNPTLELIGVLVTMMDSRTTLSRQVHEEIVKHFPGKVFETAIPRNVRIAEAPSHGVPVGAYDRWSKGARAYKSVTKELVDRLVAKGVA